MGQNKIKVYAYVVADLLHIGHLKYLEKSKKQGDYLIVGVLSDKATMEKKPKPIIPFEERLAMVRALACVDRVVEQKTYSPLNNVRIIKPDILIESTSHEEMSSNEYVDYYGGKVVIFEYYDGQSSTKIKNKIKEL